MTVSWDVTFPDGKHKLTFFHNTLSGNRVVRLDGKQAYSSGWMFKLVGRCEFTLTHAGKKHECLVIIRPSGLDYEYSLTVDGKSLTKHTESIRKISRTWTVAVDGKEHIVVLEKDKMAVCVDGDYVDVKDEFVEDGTEATFAIDGHECCIHTRKGEGGALEQTLYVDDEEVPEKFENRLLI